MDEDLMMLCLEMDTLPDTIEPWRFPEVTQDLIEKMEIMDSYLEA